MELKLILESILFSSSRPLPAAELRKIVKATAETSEDQATQGFKKVKLTDMEEALKELAAELDGMNRSFQLLCVAGAWQFVNRIEYAPWLKTLLGEKDRPARLSQPALETLAIIAYRQPVTRSEMEQVRGVSVDGVVHKLLERGLIEEAGRAEVVGRPMLYKTTGLFLEYFGLESLEALPAAEELRRIPVEKPETLATVDPGLATAPPEEIKQGSTQDEDPNQAATESKEDSRESDQATEDATTVELEEAAPEESETDEKRIE